LFSLQTLRTLKEVILLKRSFIKYLLLTTLALAFITGEASAVPTNVTMVTTGIANISLFTPSGPRLVEKTPNGNLCALIVRNPVAASGTFSFIYSTDNGVTWSDDVYIERNVPYVSDGTSYRGNSAITFDSNNNIFIIIQATDADASQNFLKYVKLTWTGSSYVIGNVKILASANDGSDRAGTTVQLYWIKGIIKDVSNVLRVFYCYYDQSLSAATAYGLAVLKSSDDGATWTNDTACNIGSTTLASAMDANTTVLTVNDATGFNSEGTQVKPGIINVGGEWMVYQTRATGTNYLSNVRRGEFAPATNTTAATTLATDTVIRAGNNIDLATTLFANPSGTIDIEGERISYGGISGNQFYTLTRNVTIRSTCTTTNTVAAADTSIIVSGGDIIGNGYNPDGVIRIDNELISYTGVGQNANATNITLTGCVRGVLPGMVAITGSSGSYVTITSSVAATHAASSVIYQGERLPHGKNAKITKFARTAHSIGETVYAVPVMAPQFAPSVSLYRGYPVIFFVNAGYNTQSSQYLSYMYYDGQKWNGPTVLITEPSAFAKRSTNGAFAWSPVATENGELQLAAWTNIDRVLRHFQFTGTTWVSTIITQDNTYLSSPFTDVGLTTNGKDLNCFYVKTNAANQYVICSKMATESGSTWTWGTETTIATDTNTSIFSNHSMETVSYSGKSGYFPVMWTEGHTSPYYYKMEKQQTPLLVRAVSPVSAANTAPATLSISGLGFFNTVSAAKVSAVKLSNGIVLSSPVVSDDLTISSVVLPSGVTAGTYNVVVTDSAGLSATSAAVFTVTGSAYSAPTVTAVTPSSGYNVSPSTVTITGANFMGGVGSAGFTSSVALSVSGNTYQLTGWTVANESTINGAVLAAGTPIGTYNVLVTTGAGVSPSGSAVFTVIAGPDVTSITPASGSEGSAATLTLTGSGFFAGTSTGAVTAINLNDGVYTFALSGYSSISDSVITGAVVPVSVFASTYNVRITTSATTNLTSTAKFAVSRYSPSNTGVMPVTNGGNGYYIPSLRKMVMNSDGKAIAFFQNASSAGGYFSYSVCNDPEPVL